MSVITKIPRSIKPSSNAKFWSVGNSADYFNWGSTANQNGIEMRLRSSAASGDSRGIYLRLKLYGAGGGEAGRFFANASTTLVATGGTINGIHSSMSIDASCSVSGAGNGLRATLGAAAATRTLGGTLAAIQLDSDIGAGNTMPSTHAFARITNSGSVALSNLFIVPNAANGTLLAAHTTQTMTHSMKMISADGTAYYIMCCDAATNRS